MHSVSARSKSGDAARGASLGFAGIDFPSASFLVRTNEKGCDEVFVMTLGRSLLKDVRLPPGKPGAGSIWSPLLRGTRTHRT